MPITINLHGRLGNQLFQYATLRNISIKTGYDFVFNTNFKDHTRQPCLLSNFNIKDTNNLYKTSNFINTYQQPNTSSFYDINVYNIKDNTELKGFFENINYFKENKETIQDELKIINKEINIYVDNYIHGIVNNKENKLVGIHFRRGDVIQQLIATPQNKSVEDFDINMKNFVYNALAKLQENEKNITLLLFTGGIRKCKDKLSLIKHSQEDDILWLKQFILENKINCNVHISPGSIENNELIDYDLMSKCDYLIIPYKSTFSFMAYYLSKKCIKLFSPNNLYGYNI